jgi:hypothetical protein
MIKIEFENSSTQPWWSNFIDMLWKEFEQTANYKDIANNISDTWYQYVDDRCKEEGFKWVANNSYVSSTILLFPDAKTLVIAKLKWS